MSNKKPKITPNKVKKIPNPVLTESEKSILKDFDHITWFDDLEKSDKDIKLKKKC